MKVLRWWGGTIEGWTGCVVGKAIGRRLLIRHGLSGSGLGGGGGKPATGDATSDVTSKHKTMGVDQEAPGNASSRCRLLAGRGVMG